MSQQPQQLQTSSATHWGNQDMRALSSRAAPGTPKFRQKERDTSFFIRSIFAGGTAGCAVRFLFNSGNND